VDNVPGDQSFGARLRQRREERHIRLIAIADQTKLKLSLLQALERDDVSHWPSGIFRRAYIRTYAQFIGLDPDVVVREFLEAHPDPGDIFVATTAAEAAAEEEAAAKNAAPSVRLRTIVYSAIGSLNKLRRPGAAEDPAPAGAPPRVVVLPDPVVAHAPQPAATPIPVDHANDPTGTAVDAPPPPDRAAVGSEAVDLERTKEVTAEATPTETQTSHDAILEALAHLCTELRQVVDRSEVQRLLQKAAGAFDATGLIVWLWEQSSEELRLALVHGYSDKLLAHLPTVKRDADDATAAAFRSKTTCEVASTPHTSGALVVPLLIPEGCGGVLAVELQQGIRSTGSCRAAAIVLAAALAQLVHRSRPADPRAHERRPLPAASKYRPPVVPHQ